MPHIVNTGSVGPGETQPKAKDDRKPVAVKDRPKVKAQPKS